MKKYYVEGNEVSALEKAKHKLKQLYEASELLVEFSDRCCWAEDCSEYATINEALDSVYTAVEHSKSEIDEMIIEIEDHIERLEEAKKEAEIEVVQGFEGNIQYCLD